ncbi:MAG: hypothetical protein KAW67_09415 [Candidatus Eisenbacteria sp.]|nr:hypothetical protein [Candidatus Eisenbacteria bacterium]
MRRGWWRVTLAFGRGSAMLLVVALAAGCGSTSTTEADSAHFVGTYLDPSDPTVAIRLDVHAGGTFTLILCGQGFEDPGERTHEVTRGSWALFAEGIQLDAEEWHAALVSHSIPVTVHGRCDTLPGVRWTSESECAPLKSGQLVRWRELEEFVHPREGFGTSGM